MCDKKDCNCKDKAVVFPSFLSYQSSNESKEMMELVFKCAGELMIEAKKHDIKLYTNIQAGVPGNLCGFTGYPPCK